MTNRQTPTVVHIIYRLDIGGLETVLVEFINRCQEDEFKHVILCLTDFTSFKNRIRNKNIKVIALHKKPGNDIGAFFNIFSLLKSIKPEVVHTYNISCLEYQLAAFLARIHLRIHAEHGRDNSDIYGENKKYNLLRKVMDWVVHYWVPVSEDLKNWLIEKVKIPEKKVILIHNGVDLETFNLGRQCTTDRREFVVGTVGRLDAVKDHKNLIVAFSQVYEKFKQDGVSLRLKIVGEGVERLSLEKLIAKLALENFIELQGAKENIAEILNGFDVFVLSSRAEGIPMTVLEACSSGLPVVATDVGGLREIIEENGSIGFLVPPEEPEALAEAICKYYNDADLIYQHGSLGKERMAEKFSLNKMTSEYLALYHDY